MKLFITGAAGFVGAAVARAALRAGHAVIVAIRPGRRPERIADLIEQLKVVAVDLRDTASVRLAIEQSRPDVIIHVAWAGVGNKDRFDRLQISDNIATTCALVDAGVEYGARKFVGIGSQGEYGPLNRKISEQDLPRPTTLYGAGISFDEAAGGPGKSCPCLASAVFNLWPAR
jgi:nucleoside-diphosphate-sugar epimerase